MEACSLREKVGALTDEASRRGVCVGVRGDRILPGHERIAWGTYFEVLVAPLSGLVRLEAVIMFAIMA
jgi:hypothetical protein